MEASDQCQIMHLYQDTNQAHKAAELWPPLNYMTSSEKVVFYTLTQCDMNRWYFYEISMRNQEKKQTIVLIVIMISCVIHMLYVNNVKIYLEIYISIHCIKFYVHHQRD